MPAEAKVSQTSLSPYAPVGIYMAAASLVHSSIFLPESAIVKHTIYSKMAPTPAFVSARDLSDFTPPKDPLFGATPVPTGPTEGPLFNIPPLPEPHQTQPWDFPPWTGTALAIILITGCCIFALWIAVDCWLGDGWWGHSCGMKRKLTMAEKCAILDAKKAAEAAEAVSQNASTEAKALESTNATPEFHSASTETLVVPQISTPAAVHFAVSAVFRVIPPNTLQNKRQSVQLFDNACMTASFG
ncbi:hypothetical protein C8R43DRAFT_1022084 [Mycena crocata]|nr:hypothetical protein C8R43DRAFT_1022084 [Mycena crocata]